MAPHISIKHSHWPPSVDIPVVHLGADLRKKDFDLFGRPIQPSSEQSHAETRKAARDVLVIPKA